VLLPTEKSWIIARNKTVENVSLSILQRIRLSILTGKPEERNDQQSQRNVFRSFLLHFRPASVPERTLDFSLSWGQGGMALVLVILLFASGLMLKFSYEPSPARAYASIIHLVNQVRFGQLLRNLHHWSANGLLLVVFLHCLRVFYTGAFTGPRQLTWSIGLVLFAAVLLSNFTGYLLPWDQRAYWAITISTSMLDYLPAVGTGLREWILGGSEPGPGTLVNFYAIHTAILPALLLFFVPWHFWRIRKANGLVIPRRSENEPMTAGEMVDSMPHLIIREAAIALLVLAAVLLISMFFNAPLDAQANPGLSPNPTKAPWYFMGVQELLIHFHPLFAVLVIPGLLVLGLLLIPYFNYEANTAGVWFCSARGRKMALAAAILASVATPAAVWFDAYATAVWRAGPAGLVSNGLLPFAVLLAVCAGFYWLVKKTFQANNNEAIQAMFTLLVTSFVVLTVIGVWFRGAGMQLGWAV